MTGMILTTQSTGYSIAVKQQGAELSSFRTPGGTELLWQADPAIWPRHAPNLFPIVGRLRDDSFAFRDKAYPLKQHGFARDTDFAITGNQPGHLTFRLEPSTATRAIYPFEFVLDIEYRLAGRKLSTTYHVRNPGNSPLPFSLGAHPAFACAWQHGDTVSDYFLEFSQAENTRTHLLENGLLSGQSLPLLEGTDRIRLTPHTFDRDALILLDHQSRAVTLRRHDDPRQLTVAFPEFPHLGIWSKPGAPFVCIEPWIGHADPVTATGNLFAKSGMIVLNAGKTFSATFSIEASGF